MMKKIVLILLAVSIGSMMAFAGDSQQILTFAEAMGFTRYEMSDMKHSGSVRYVAWSPDGHRLASVNRDKTVKIWNAESEQYAHCHNTDGLVLWLTRCFSVTRHSPLYLLIDFPPMADPGNQQFPLLSSKRIQYTPTRSRKTPERPTISRVSPSGNRSINGFKHSLFIRGRYFL